MRFLRAAAFAGLIAAASTLCFAADPPSPAPDTIPPSTRLLQVLKRALDGNEFLQEQFCSDENLKSLFEATSIQWAVKEDDPPHIGRMAIIRSALVPEADIRASSLFVPGASTARRVYIAINRVRLTREQVIAVFGTPVEWTGRASPRGDHIPLALRYGVLEETPQAHWDGVARTGASFSVARDGAVSGIIIVATGPYVAAKPPPGP